jgi:hypothetical protein
MRSSRRWLPVLFGAASVVLGGYEIWSVFVRETPAVQIQGYHLKAADEFGRGARVTQAFRMLGGGLSDLDVQFSTDRPLTLMIRCEVTETDDRGEHPRTVANQVVTAKRVSGVEWRRISFAPVDSSDKRWYFLRLELIGSAAADDFRPGAVETSTDRRDRVAVMVSRDNVFGGGAMWIADNRQLGSLSLRAFSRRRTAYARFRAGVTPSLPPPLRSGFVDIAIAVVYQAALLTVIYAWLAGGATRRRVDAGAAR